MRNTRNIFTNAGHKSQSLENNESNENSKQRTDHQDRNVDKNEPKGTNNQSHWPSGTCALVGDSMMNDIDKKNISGAWK